MKDDRILTKLKKFDCDIDNLTNYQNGCGECRVCKYLEFLDYAGSVGMPGGSTVEYNKEIDRYLEIREFYKSLLAKKMEEALNTDKVTRIEVVDYTKDVLDDNRRAYVKWDKDIKVELSFQDDNRTLKVFISNKQ